MDCIYNLRAILAWVPFKRSWGQSSRLWKSLDWTKDYDPSMACQSCQRRQTFTMWRHPLTIHHYPDPSILIYTRACQTLSGSNAESGMWFRRSHIWSPERNWGYIEFKSPQEVNRPICYYARYTCRTCRQGEISGACVTQTTDGRGEVNGPMTYDRKVVKIDVPRVSRINKALSSLLERIVSAG